MDPAGVSTAPVTPTLRQRKLPPALAPSRSSCRAGGGAGGEDRKPLGGGGGGGGSLVFNLPRGAGLDWREPPAGCGESGRRLAGGGGEVGARCGGQAASQLAEKVLGAPWRSAVWGRGRRSWEGAEQVRKDVRGYWGVTQRTRLSLGREATGLAGCLRFQGGESPGEASVSPANASPTRPNAPGTRALCTALGGRELREPACAA